MAVITSAALAGTAITAATIASGVGVAATVGTTAMSFANAGKQRKLVKEAEEAAGTAMAEARKKLGINYTDEMAIKKEPYELQREAMLSQGAQAIQAGIESERGAAATAGKVQMAMNEAQAGIRTAMGAEMTDIEKQQIAEQSRLRDLGVQLDLGEVEGAQMEARNAEQASAAATAQGIQGIMGTAKQGLNMMPLFFKDSSTPMGGTSADSPGTQISSTAAKYGGSSFTPMDTPLNPLGFKPQFTGANGVVPQAAPKFGGTFNPNTQPMFPQYDAFGNVIR